MKRIVRRTRKGSAYVGRGATEAERGARQRLLFLRAVRLYAVRLRARQVKEAS